jgi:UDP:flavonoid glycosyltransferase YjiC (YdhE family)
MARFLFCTGPFVGHITPGLPIARALVQRGHEVRWYTGHAFQARVEATGARFEPPVAALDFDDQNLEATFPGISALTGLAALKFGIMHLFLDTAAGQVADLWRILADFPADVLVSDTAFVGATLVEELGGPPRAVYGITPLTLASRDTAPFGMALPPPTSSLGRLRNRGLYSLFDHVLFRDVHAHYARVRVAAGLPPSRAGLFGDAVSRRLFLQGTVPSFEYPRRDLPPQVHFVGPFLPDPPANFCPPSWWTDLHARTRPVVHVTQGTVSTVAQELIVPTVRALAGEHVLVVATTGGQPVERVGLDPVPANVRLERFIPHGHLLSHVDVMVTNGGYGGVQTALAHGVPLVVAGRTEEKPEVAARVAWAGVGLNLKTNRPTPERIRRAVQTILDDPAYKRNAARIQTEIAQHDPATEAAVLLERLVTAERLAEPPR